MHPGVKDVNRAPMFYPGTGVYKFVPHLIPYCCLKIMWFNRGTLRWLKGAQRPLGGKRWIQVGPIISPGLEVFRIGITLDASMTLLKAGCLRGTLRWFKGA